VNNFAEKHLTMRQISGLMFFVLLFFWAKIINVKIIVY